MKKLMMMIKMSITIIGERRKPFSRVFNDQPRDIYMEMSIRTFVSNTHAHVSMSV